MIASHVERKLRYEIGPVIAMLLEDPQVEDINVNPDGKIFPVWRGRESECVGEMSAAAALAAACTVATDRRAVFTPENPHLETYLRTGERFSAIGTNVVEATAISIRKRNTNIYSLLDFVRDGCMTMAQRDVLSEAVKNRKNIVVAGGPGAGKTTFLNALLQEMSSFTPHDRLIIIEDTREIQSPLANTVQITADNLRYWVRAAMRFRPDRIVVGEVRGDEAYEMFKAWNTGVKGSFASVHSNSAPETFRRLEHLVLEDEAARAHGMAELTVREAVDVVVYMAGDSSVSVGRKVKDIYQKDSLAEGFGWWI